MSRQFILLATVVAIGTTAAPAAQAAPKSYSPLDEYMLQSSIQGDRFEIAGGQLAQSNGTSPTIKALGARLVKDHTKSLSDAVKVARNLGISVPKTPTPSQEWELSTLGSLPAANFDAAYATLEVQDHKQDIDDTKMEISDGVNAKVKRLAREDLPVLRRHLKLSKQAAAGV
jgi:putative membrane protein